ncbi:glycosyltransferase family 4 protein [Clostridium algidicarnis]|uniref:glycosyltransferase family 4 protein n=1 Tax=Clostridium algidicarnis TaxID=37659 RepID=UPI000496200A|nr:glycosyltransferase family 4 protein [Clostridium algidicarnis]
MQNNSNLYNKKRILHITSQKPDKTGSGIYAREIMSEGHNHGYAQALICGIQFDENFKPSFIEDKNYYPVYFKTKSLPFSVVGMSDIMPYDSTRYDEIDEAKLSALRYAFKKVIDKAIKEFQPEIIICHHLWLLTAFIKNLYPSLPMMVISHGSDLRQLELNPRFKPYVIENCRKIDKILALNEENKNLIANILGINEKNIEIIGSGYNKDLFYVKEYVDKCKYTNLNNSDIGNGSTQKKKIEIVYAGKISFSKGLSSLISSLNNLSFNKDELNITLIGGGAGLDTLEIKKQAENCKYNITFTGAIPQENLANYFRNSDIFVLPSFYEGLPLVIIEALASGLRVVVNDLPGIKSWIGENINKSGVIEYVQMPKMLSVDAPYEYELFEYEKRLSKAIETQIYKVLNLNKIDEKILDEIKEMSWDKVFEKLEKVLICVTSS